MQHEVHRGLSSRFRFPLFTLTTIHLSAVDVGANFVDFKSAAAASRTTRQGILLAIATSRNFNVLIHIFQLVLFKDRI
ncbi:BZ3500_MvSof-1268-A1-R1_Chr9g10438 [Microbotryum saponariae]|uniref:BZ3500_MvSof-1268-A1-R1_Chr9g10438 protein n=1 Tax=Microbotryum saponariae TaxID=289078 RepID=A0A2X0LM43_9BASI|nr:BZ3501_MvSof-1269-A2-R1_Chr9g10188 [Microbotryum saponariae]SDA00093.1 BZ3500_MvSof-1268-A1-R1_Chr9g10438 [Microbotryum saponariae]